MVERTIKIYCLQTSSHGEAAGSLLYTEAGDVKESGPFCQADLIIRRNHLERTGVDPESIILLDIQAYIARHPEVYGPSPFKSRPLWECE
ncbi:MAG: hypothetical protein UX87_C0008G0008 [Candidatus Amesbacteria bacterium GW2011_GWA1_47_16]|uniref:Uncharacterized protein n=1 Tax=Candidatus Amesbacteria bacterium GW2011_GWA1_47_16 TaxID=1618353 RepID=A0A0G1V377_9BACT|nr:MAG: hypothetical protein UX87_C0008G0008 [Candidatus Amesbacteria bacterium GW2011_GWA1_47_16]